jgi:hypothetical protein
MPSPVQADDAVVISLRRAPQNAIQGWDVWSIGYGVLHWAKWSKEEERYLQQTHSRCDTMA